MAQLRTVGSGLGLLGHMSFFSYWSSQEMQERLHLVSQLEASNPSAHSRGTKSVVSIDRRGFLGASRGMWAGSQRVDVFLWILLAK